MQMTKTQKIIISILVIVLLFGGYVYFDRKSREANEANTAVSTQTQSTTTADGVQISTGGTGSYTITPVPITEGQTVPQPIPDLNRPVHPAGSATVSSDAIVAATSQILTLEASLKNNPNDPASWIALGEYQKE